MTKATAPMIKSPPTTAYAVTQPIKGPSFLVFRRQGKRIRKEKRNDARPPRFRHPTFEAAQTEAARLARLYPESTFVVICEMVTVKAHMLDGLRPKESERHDSI